MANIDPVDNQYTAAGAIADLDGAATLADTITTVNAMLAALRDADIISGA